MSARLRRPSRAAVIAIVLAARRATCTRRWRGLGLATVAVIVPVVTGSSTDDSTVGALDVVAWPATPGRGDPPVSAPVVDSNPVGATGEGETAGIEVTIETPGEVLAGTRTPIDVSVHNTGTETFYWQAGGCGLAVEVTTGPVDRDVDGYSGRVSADAIWNGDPAALEAAITASEAGRGIQLAQPEFATGSVSLICTAHSEMQPFAPGDELSYNGSAELRVPPGPLPGGGVYEAAATFTPYGSPDDYPNQPLDPVEARVRLTVVEDPARGADPVDSVVGAIVADGRLASWLPTTVLPDRPDLVQDYRVGMTWWRDAWELWIEPYWGGGMLRVRVDPADNEVIDVRTHDSNGPPNDEPRATSIPGSQPDQNLRFISTSTSP